MSDPLIASLPFFWFLLISGVTPGPNNVMLMASGIRFGYIRTLPHILGVCSGFLVLMLLCGFGLGEVYQHYPVVQWLLKSLGAAYLLYLAWRIFTSTGVTGAGDHRHEHPLTFIEAAGFQFINPKAVVFGIAATNLIPTGLSLVWLATVILLAVIPAAAISTHLWTLFGTLLSHLFTNDRSRRIINTLLALLLVLTLPLMLF